MISDFDRLSIQAIKVFSPSAPVDKVSLFAGRISQLQRVVDCISARGQHAIVYGERGVGKTSLANIIHETLEAIGFGEFRVFKVNCDSTDNFTSAWKKALKRVEYVTDITPPEFQPTTKQYAGFDPVKKQYLINFAQQMTEKITPDDIYSALIHVDSPLVFIFDEFDRMKAGKNARLFADIMKALSDYAAEITLILVGVADSVENLIGGHESIVRSLKQIRMQRMSETELREILSRASNTLGITMQEDSIKQIIHYSQGLPHYTHLLGLAATRSALGRQSRTVEITDVKQAIRVVIDGTEESIINAYLKAISSPRSTHLYCEVLLACALAKTDELSFFTAKDVCEPLNRITRKEYQTPTFFQHLNSFCTSERANVLVKVGETRNFRYRFKNPLLIPYTIIRGRVEGLLKDDMVDLIPLW